MAQQPQGQLQRQLRNVGIFLWRCGPTLSMASSFMRFLDHTQRRTTFGWNPLDEWSARRRDLYLTTHNTHNRQTSMPSVGFEPTTSAGERPQTYSLDRAATGIGTEGKYTNTNNVRKHGKIIIIIIIITEKQGSEEARKGACLIIEAHSFRNDFFHVAF